MYSFKNDPMYRFLIVLTIASSISLQGWRTLFNNFAVEIGHIEGNQMGIIQGIREIPGFLSLLVIFVLFFIKEHRLSALSIIITGLGVAMTGFFPSFIGLTLTTLIMSFGFHYYETTNQSLTLQYFAQSSSPWVLGQQRSYSAASNIFIGVFIYLISDISSYLNMYLVIGIIVMLLGFWGLVQNPTRLDMVPQRRQMFLRKKYFLFYFLTFLSGARRQIFVAFSVFLMVKMFNYTIRDITILFVINNIINYFLSPAVGRVIIRFGERGILTVEALGSIGVFLGYAYSKENWVIAVLYVLDSIFFNFSIAIRTYFQKVADPADIASSMAVGFTINHVAAVVIPLVSGMLWMIDYKIPFLAAVVMSLMSLMATLHMKQDLI